MTEQVEKMDASFPAVQAFLDRYILRSMCCGFGDGSFDWTAFHLRNFVNDWVTKDMARAILRDLSQRGYAKFERGLFTEDGDVAGSGYRITKEGIAYLETLESN